MDSPKSYTVRTETGEIRLMTKQQVGQMVKNTLHVKSPKESSLPRPAACRSPPSPYTATSQRLSRSPRGMPRKFQFRSSDMKPKSEKEEVDTSTTDDDDVVEPSMHSTLSPSNKSVTELVSLSIRRARQNASKKKNKSFQSVWRSNDVTTSPIKKHSTFSWSLDDDDENRICGQFEDLIISDESATLGGNTMGDTTAGTATLNRYDTLDAQDDDDRTVNTVNTSKKEKESTTPTNNYQSYKIFRSFFTPNKSPEIANIIEETMRRAKETAIRGNKVHQETYIDTRAAAPDGILKTEARVEKVTVPDENDTNAEQREEEEEENDALAAVQPVETDPRTGDFERREPVETYDTTEASMSTQEQSLSECIHGAGEALQQQQQRQPTPRANFSSFSETPRLFNGKRRIKTFHIIEEKLREEVGVELQIESTSASLTSSTPEEETSSEQPSQGDKQASFSTEDKSFSSTSLTHTPLIPDSKIDIVPEEPEEQTVAEESTVENEAKAWLTRGTETTDKVSYHEPYVSGNDSIDTAELKETAAEEILSIDSDESPYGPYRTEDKETEFSFSDKGRKLSVETALYTPLNGKKEAEANAKAKSTTSVPSRPLLMVKQCPSSDDEFPLATSVRKTLSESLHSTTSSRLRSNSVSDSSFKKGRRRQRSRSFRLLNRKRTESYETKGSSVITEEFLKTISSMKGEQITPDEITMILQGTTAPDRAQQGGCLDSENTLDTLAGNYITLPTELKALFLSNSLCLDLMDLISPLVDMQGSNEEVPDEFQNDSNYETTESATDVAEEEHGYDVGTTTENDETDEGFEMTVTEKRVTFSFSDGMPTSSEDDTTATTGVW